MKALIAGMMVLALVGCSSKIDQQKFDALNRAGRTVKENTAVGVTLMKFRDVMSAYATEVSLAQDRATGSLEKRFVVVHGEALKAYRDSLVVWNSKLEHHGADGLAAYPGSDLRRIVDDHGLEGAFSGDNFMFDADPAIQKIWIDGRIKLDIADALYRGDHTTP